MQKMLPPISDGEHGGFSWVRDPDFTPPDRDGGVDNCLAHEFAMPRAGELRALLKIFLDSIIGTVNATAAVVRLLSPDGRTLRIIGSAGLSAELQEEAENFLELDCEVSNNATFSHVIHAADVSSCNARENCCYTSCRFQSLIAAQLEGSGTPGIPLGILTVFFDAPRLVSRRATNTIAAFAEVMSATIEHTRTNREISRVQRLAARQEIANDIHDSLAQTLTYARMRVSLLQESIRTGNEALSAKYATDLDEALEIGQRTARELVKDFRSELNPGGLQAALQDLTDQFRAHNNIELEYHNRLPDIELPLEYEIQAYQIVREALTNIARHSGATHARLFVDTNFGYYVFTIEDNGSGARTFTPVEGHYGMMIMRERAHHIGGEVRVDSAPGLGTKLQLFFPEP